MKQAACFLIITIILLSTTVFAFDGKRTGFIIGGGLGLTPSATWKVDEYIMINGKRINVSLNEDKVGFGLNIVIGYGWNEKNIIAFEINSATYNTDLFPDPPNFNTFNQSVFQGTYGFSWYHYYGNIGKSFFSTVGLGIFIFDIEDYKANDVGAGLLLGGGYEFARHVQIGLYLGVGKTSSEGIDFTHSNLSVLLNAFAF